MDEGVADLERRGAVHTLTRTRWTGKRHETDTYRLAQALPLCDTDTALAVNGCELTTTDAPGKGWYRNAFATTGALTADTVVEVVVAGRRRWKIENENHNVPKTQGDHFEHHYGHGQQHGSSLLASLILLALLTHTVLEWLDDRYRLRRQKLPSRQRRFNDIRTLTTYRCFDRWAALTAFMLNSFDQPPPPLNTG